MKIFGINNVPSFMACIRRCSGDVVFEDRNGKLRDLKELARKVEGIENIFSGARLDELTIYARTPEDQVRLLHYIAEMALAS